MPGSRPTRPASPAARPLPLDADFAGAVLAVLQDGILVVDADNRILQANAAAAELLAGGNPVLAGQRLADLTDGPALEKLAGEIRRTGRCPPREITLQAVDSPGDVAGLRLGAGVPAADAAILLVLRNLARLRKLERAGEEYATNVSHELKTPLTLILGYAETLLAHPEMEAEYRDRSLRTIERHTRRILRIIDDLLRLAWLKSENDALGIPRTKVSVAGIVAKAAEFCQEWLRAADIAVKIQVPTDLAWRLNAGLMEEAIVNLIRNAILYALAGPIEIRARQLNNGHLEIAVIDRGPGLKPEDASRIFDRFYRVDKSRSRASGGSGLGLPIVQQIVEAHHGTARVESTPGEGCTFILDIPPAPREADA